MSALITEDELATGAPACDADKLAALLTAAAASHGIDTPLRLAHWLSQLSVESLGFTRFEENLNYSAKRLMQVWPHRFPTLEDATAVAHNPQAIANLVYAGRMGNSEPGDGWRFRGRGPAMLTGRDNYAETGHAIGVDLIADPDAAAEPGVMAKIAAVFWQRRNLNHAADCDDIVAITEAWNGGLIGLPDRRAALSKFKTVLGLVA